MTVVNEDLFILIEHAGPTGVTADELAKWTGSKVQTMHTWLSRWTKRRCLKHIPFEGHIERITRRKPGRPPGSIGRYIIGPVEWSSYRWRDDQEIDESTKLANQQ
jgi:hypothetical protein